MIGRPRADGERVVLQSGVPDDEPRVGYCRLPAWAPAGPGRHFEWFEVFQSRHTLDIPTGAELGRVLLNAIRLAHALDALRDMAGAPLRVTSWYRDPRVNALVGGQPTSHHLDGTGADLAVPHDSPTVAHAKILLARRVLAEALWHKGHLHVAVARL